MANDMKTLKVIASNGTFAFPVKDQTARDAAAEAQTAADGAQTAAQEAKEAAQTAQGMAQSASNAAGNAQQTAAAAQATAQAAKQAADGITIPTVLPNPFKLMFTGGATGEYDGSKAVTINIPTGGEGGGSGPVQYVESLDESNLANLRDLTTGTYVLYGYFVPFAGSSDTMTCDNTLVSVAHLSAGSHVLVFNPLNCKVNFIEILVDESAASGFTYSVQIIDMRDLPALIEAVGSRDSLTTDDKSTIVAAINEVAQKGGTVTDEQIASAVEDYMAEHPVTGGAVATIEPAEDDIPKVFFVGEAPTTKAQDELPLTMEYISKTKRIFSHVTLKVQGDSSAKYAKKNFNIKLFSDEARSEKQKVIFRDWLKTHKYCLKANWIDHTHARNVVNGRLWNQVVRSRADIADYPAEYQASPHSGAVDGFPVKVYINGVYQGIYTWNIRKDESMFNMDDETGTHAALIADGVNTITAWRELPVIGGGDWTDELNDTVPDAVKTSFQNAYSFVMESTDEEFRANISNYFYLSSLIDYYIFIYSILMVGGLAKSQTMLTYDAVKFIANIYDMDTTWALYWTGANYYDIETACPNEYEHTAGYNLLYERLVKLFPNEIKARFAELRSSVLSDANIINEFEQFMDVIGNDLYAEDFAETTANGAFTAIPSTDTNNLQKLREIIVKRMAYCDENIPLIGTEEPDAEEVPATGITLSANTLTFTEAETQTITATVEPSDTTDSVVWSTDDSGVATVEDGVVTAVGNGSCTITATIGAHSATCAVSVSGVSTGDEPEEGDTDALYPLTNGTFTPVDVYGVTAAYSVEITNGNHVKITNPTETDYNAKFVNLTNPEFGYVNNIAMVFSIPENATVKYEISNLTTDMTSAGFRVANSSSGISTLAINGLTAPGGCTETTVTTGYDIGAVFIYGNLLAGCVIEFDVSLTINGVKYI